MSRAVKLLSGGVVIGVVLVGCSAGPQIDEDGRILLAQPSASASRMLAAVDGTLTVLDGGCIGLTGEQGDRLVVFPPGTHFVEDGGIEIPHAGRFAVGDAIPRGGGGVVPLSASPVPVPEVCEVTEVTVLDPYES